MTIRDMCNAGIELQGNINIVRYYEDGNYRNLLLTNRFGELWPDDNQVFDIDVAYIYPEKIDGEIGICIELEGI